MDTRLEIYSSGPDAPPALYLHQGDRVIAMSWADWQELITTAGFVYTRWLLVKAGAEAMEQGGIAATWAHHDAGDLPRPDEH